MSSSSEPCPPAKENNEQYSAPATNVNVHSTTATNPSIRFALERLCSRESRESVETFNEKDSVQCLEVTREEEGGGDDGQCIQVRKKVNDGEDGATLQSLSPNEQQTSPERADYLTQSKRRSYFRPISLMARRSSSTASDEEEDQATFEDCFFDLLFSASLSVYGSAASLTSFASVGQFMAFFALLWWSWWCQTLYDVRYRSRQRPGPLAVFAHRGIRILLLGSWVAFSTSASEYSRGSYSGFCLVYTLTRASLLADYLISAFDPPPAHRVYAKKTKRSSRFFCHFISMAATSFSLLCWGASRFLTSKAVDKVMTPVVFSLWTLSVLIEMGAQVFVELYGPFGCLSTTHLVERLALFSLIIFGGGYENIGLALNAISPREATQTSAATGWRFGTVLNAISAVAIIMLLFFGYFSKAVKRLQAPPIIVLSWSYLHIILHIASAVVVIGLSKLISFSNTAEALKEFDLHPTRYLPNTLAWQSHIQSHFPTLVDFDSIPVLGNMTTSLDYQVASIQLSILATQGAIIPTVRQASLLINSARGFQGMEWPAALQTQLQSYYGLVDSVQNARSGTDFVHNNLFQFYYCYATAGVYMLTDVALKYMQSTGETSGENRSNFWSWVPRSRGARAGKRMPLILFSLPVGFFRFTVRISFSIFLFMAQIAYIELHNKLPNSGLVTLVLPILAGTLLVESLLQSVVANARLWKSKVVQKAGEKRQEMKKVRNVSRR